MREVSKDIISKLRKKTPLVLATVTRSVGSTPQKPGSTAVFSPEGLVAGTVGGGVLEHEVHQLALQALRTRRSSHVHFNLHRTTDEEGAICGGETFILLDALPGHALDNLERMQKSLRARIPGALVTIVHTAGEEVKTGVLWVTAGDTVHAASQLEEKTLHHILEILRSSTGPDFLEIPVPAGRAGTETLLFVERVYPLPRLLIAGAGHIGKALAHLGKLLDFEVTVIDDRSEYASPQLIPGADRIIVKDIGRALQEETLGDDSYVVIVTRGHRHDTEALRPCIGSGAAYVGMIGSANKVATMKKNFLAEGWATGEQWDRVYTPIGLPIGSKTVQEIAVSIAAQLVQVRTMKNKPHDGDLGHHTRGR